jgi:predicted RNA binding protein YcfA (HicA-like mRNA interferase family)
VKQVSGRAFCRLLERHGWTQARISGSHHIYEKPGERVKLTVPVHGNTPLKPGLLRFLLKAADLTEADL